MGAIQAGLICELILRDALRCADFLDAAADDMLDILQSLRLWAYAALKHPAFKQRQALESSRLRCPSCKLENPETASRCDCGYTFIVAAIPLEKGLRTVPNPDPSSSLYLRSIDDSLRIIKRIVIGWAVLTVIGTIILLLRH